VWFGILSAVWSIAVVAAVQSGDPPDSIARTGSHDTAARNVYTPEPIPIIPLREQDAEEIEMTTDVTIWRSADGIWTNASSWTNGVPTNVKTARFAGLSQKAVRGDAAAPVCWRLEITEDFAGDIASQGQPLALAVTNSIVHRGRGGLYLNMDAAAHPWVLINCRNERAVTFLDGNVNRLLVMSGRVSLAPTADVSYQTCIIGLMAHLTAAAGPNDTYDLGVEVNVIHGTLINGKAWGTDCRITQLGGIIESSALLVAGNVLSFSGGRYTYTPITEPTDVSGPVLLLWSGVFDVSQSAWDVYATRTVIGEDLTLVGRLWHCTGAVFACQQPIDLREDWPIYTEIP
jgi:hypothetical protein